MDNALLLGLLQGIFEWLPVSSEGIVAAAYTLIRGTSLSEGVQYALWLHVGTVPAALVALRKEVLKLTRDVFARPPRLTPVLVFLGYSTIISAVIGLPLLAALADVSEAMGTAAMAVIGASMLVTGAVQFIRPPKDTRQIADVGLVDGIAAGIAQGFAVIPGLSRSGLTIATLLVRRLDRQDALTLSILMSVPASLGASVYAGIDSSIELTPETLASTFVAFVTGLIAIRILLRLATKMNFAGLVFAMGSIMLIGSIWQALAQS